MIAAGATLAIIFSEFSAAILSIIIFGTDEFISDD
jgi:hypothetical protein